MRPATSFCRRSRLSAGTSDHCLARSVFSLLLQEGLNADQADIATVEMRLTRVHSVGCACAGLGGSAQGRAR